MRFAVHLSMIDRKSSMQLQDRLHTFSNASLAICQSGDAVAKETKHFNQELFMCKKFRNEIRFLSFFKISKYLIWGLFNSTPRIIILMRIYVCGVLCINANQVRTVFVAALFLVAHS